AERRAEAEAQMAPLNALFDSTDTLNIIQKTIPDFCFTDHFTKAHEELFRRHHDFLDDSNDNTSMTDTLSGTFAGNPFLFCRRLVHTMGTKIYHGTKIIHWTERYRDSNGKTRTRVRTQTLHASVTKPYPLFSTQTYLCYGSQAAPDLNFSRLPQHSERLDEDDIEKKVKKGARKLRKKAEKATQKGGNFQEMANSEFDVLFGATDRDHEVQFRLMYTPLAQQNTVDLLTSRTGFGDDFHFTKRRRFNLIHSEHAAHWEMNTSASHYYSFDFDAAKANFLTFNERYFKSLFFDFAPLFSVPAYLETPCASLEPIEEYDCNYTCFEHEVMANAIGKSSFVHPSSRTNAILKTRTAGKQGETDRVEVTAYSFTSAMRTDFVPVLGGDGRMHAVPVIWEEFLPVSRTTPMTVAPAAYSEKQLRDARASNQKLPRGTFFHGLVANTMK
ncbi:MAG: hypothetical protein IJY66_03660, partial [Clostridia bacterium]|nr:hypothetical protein [Clostridia bacterium]